MLLAEVELKERCLLSVALGRNLRLADLTSRRALQFGVTATIGAGEDHRPSQALAADMVKLGFAGLRYRVRHDPALRLYGVALFGPPGAPSRDDPDWPAGDNRRIPDDLMAEANGQVRLPAAAHALTRRPQIVYRVVLGGRFPGGARV